MYAHMYYHNICHCTDINDQVEMVTTDDSPNVIPTGKTSKSIEIMAHKQVAM